MRASLCDEEDDPQARVIAATIGPCAFIPFTRPTARRSVRPAYDYKLKWYARLRRCLLENESVGRHLAVCGDFNVAPRDEDIYDPDLWRGAIMCSEGERAAFEQLCGAGLIDTLRIHHPETGLFSWWDYRMLAFPKNRGLRIDAILASKSLAARCHGSRDRARDAQGEGTIGSCAGLGGV